jgi:hypothetical protein
MMKFLHFQTLLPPQIPFCSLLSIHSTHMLTKTNTHDSTTLLPKTKYHLNTVIVN